MDFRKIIFDRSALISGSPCVCVEGEPSPWNGFEMSNGVLFVKTGNGRNWMEFYGDDNWLIEGGRSTATQTINGEDRVYYDRMGYWPAGELDRLSTIFNLTYVTVIKQRIRQDRPAVVVYRQTRWGLSATCSDQARLEGQVRSVVVKPPISGHPEPYNCWIETTSSLIEF